LPPDRTGYAEYVAPVLCKTHITRVISLLL